MSTIEDLQRTVRGERVGDLAHMAAGALSHIADLERQVATLTDKVASIRAIANSLAIIHSTVPPPDERDDG